MRWVLENGGNPAGVLIADALPSAVDMQDIAAEVGFSETAFAAATDTGWRVSAAASSVFARIALKVARVGSAVVGSAWHSARTAESCCCISPISCAAASMRLSSCDKRV